MFTIIAAFITMTMIDQIHEIKNRVFFSKIYEIVINDFIHDVAWREVIEIKLNALTINDTWKQARHSMNINIVTFKWIFIVKYASNESMNRYKIKLIVKKFIQIHEINYDETFVSTLQTNSLRVLLALMTLKNMKVKQVNVINAFIEFDLQKVIYMHALKKLIMKNDKILRLFWSLYDLKQFAREWNNKCDKILKKMKFKKFEANSCVYKRTLNNVIIDVYVDDLLILVFKKKTFIIDEIKCDMRKQFKIKKLDEVKCILSVQIIRIKFKRIIYLNQIVYIEKFFHEFVMKQNKIKFISTSMNEYEHFRKIIIDDEPDDINEYIKRVKSMMFSMIYIKLDIKFVLFKLN